MTDPASSRRQVAARLKDLRISAGRTQQEVIESLQWSTSKIIRIEKGASGVTLPDLRAMLELYGVDDPAVSSELAEMARTSRARQQFSEFKGALSSETLRYIRAEATASFIRHVALNAVPGLLQIEDYTRALLAVYKTDEATINAVVESRARRQELLSRADPPMIHFILDEGLLHRAVGGPDTMSRQIDHLISVAENPHVTVQVLPFTIGAHAALSGPFVLLEFPTPDDQDVAFFENSLGNTFSRGEAGISDRYKVRFTELEKAASTDVLDKIAGHYSGLQH